MTSFGHWGHGGGRQTAVSQSNEPMDSVTWLALKGRKEEEARDSVYHLFG